MTSAMKARREAKREGDRLAFNKKLVRVWNEKKVCLQCIYSEDKADKFGSHEEFAEKFGVGRTPFGDNCYEVISSGKPAEKEPAKEKPAKEEPVKQADVHSAWGEKGVTKGSISEKPEKKQTPEELFNEMENFFGGDIRAYRQEVLDEYETLIVALVDIFNRNLEFVLGGSSGGRARKVYDSKAQEYLGNLENMIRELGHKMSQNFPKLPVKKYIIFRETRSRVDISGLAFMDKNIQAVAEMIEYKMRKQLEYMYEHQ